MKNEYHQLRTGFTTGACAAAASAAAARTALRGSGTDSIEITIPNGQQVVFALKHTAYLGDARASASVIKDAGDDPDCTHGIEIAAEVRLSSEINGVVITGGEGVARVTKPGLGLEVGTFAINPVPRKNITEMVLRELHGSAFSGAEVKITVPDGREVAKQTSGELLGLIGGISILGTSGIVKPYSTAAYKASIVKQISVIAAEGLKTVVLTTGGRSEKAARKLCPDLADEEFVRCGDYIGAGIKAAVKQKLDEVIIVTMIGKISKIANGDMHTHINASGIDINFISGVVCQITDDEQLLNEVKNANTARHVLELAEKSGIAAEFCGRLTELALNAVTAYSEEKINVTVHLVDFASNLIETKCFFR